MAKLIMLILAVSFFVATVSARGNLGGVPNKRNVGLETKNVIPAPPPPPSSPESECPVNPCEDLYPVIKSDCKSIDVLSKATKELFFKVKNSYINDCGNFNLSAEISFKNGGAECFKVKKIQLYKMEGNNCKLQPTKLCENRDETTCKAKPFYKHGFLLVTVKNTCDAKKWTKVELEFNCCDDQ